MKYTRRQFLTIGAESIAGVVFEQLVPMEIPDGWTPIVVKKGDTLWSICNFYEVSGWQNTICQVNQLINPSLVLAGQRLWLPVSKDYLKFPFTRFILHENGEYSYIPVTDDRNTFESYGSEAILYEEPYPYVLSGHSSPNRNFKDQFPFDPLIRKLLKNPLSKIPFWLQRTGKNSYLHGVLSGDSLGWSPNNNNVNYANSQHLVLRTCAVETPIKGDELFCLASINDYDSRGPEN